MCAYFLFSDNNIGWSVVDEYLSDDLGSDQEDVKRMREAQSRASRKQKEKKKRPTPLGKRPRSNVRSRNNDYSGTDAGTFFRGPPGPPTHQYYNKQAFGNSTWNNKSNDLCFACQRYGHWRRDCPTVKQDNRDSGANGRRM